MEGMMAMYATKISIPVGHGGLLSHKTTKEYAAIVSAVDSTEARKYVCKALELARIEDLRRATIEVLDFENGMVVLLKEGAEVHATRELC
jgi:hypothetical protein